MDEFASSKVRIAALASEYSEVGTMNEATTRLRVIDRLLQDCLGWRPGDIDSEKYHHGDYADYEIGRPAVELILEAKREGIYFALPAGIAGRRVVDIETLLTDANTKSAIEQVTHYCQDRGVPIAIICNGHQLVAFFASRQDGVPPMKGRALVFSSLEEMRDDFTLFWNYLSRDGIAIRTLQRALFGATFKAIPPTKLSDRVTDYPGYRPRTALETDLKVLGNLFIQDLEYEPSFSGNFLRQCYVPSGAQSQYALVSKEILQARYDAIQSAANVDLETARTSRNVSTRLTADIMSSAMSRRPIILIGDVGVGKSMFLRHLIGVDAADLLKNVLVIYLDFGKEPTLATDLDGFVAKRLTEQLKEDYNISVDSRDFIRAVYNKEINEFKETSLYADGDPDEFRREEVKMLIANVSDRSEHLRRSLEHIRGTSRRTVLLILDNVDQRPPEFQDRVFLIAQSVAETWPVTAFVSLRPSTFYESRSKGSLAAYQLRVFTITPTRADSVIRRRLEFAKTQLSAAGEDRIIPQNMSLTDDDLSAYLDVLIKAFNENDELNKLVENLSGGNLRLALTFLSSFVGTAYVSTERILEVARTGRTYTLPEHEFLRSMIYGDFDYYSPRTSEICNLFDITTEDGREHFLLSLMLAHIQRQGESAGGDGYVDVGELYQYLQPLGFLQEQIGPQIQRGLEKRLLEAPPGRGAGGPLRITSVGSYMYRAMIERFTYIDAMIVDTPIVDIEYRKQIRDVRPILDRLDRAEIFVQYLNDQWSNWGPSTEDLVFHWPVVSASLMDDITSVRPRATRAQQRYSQPLRSRY